MIGITSGDDNAREGLFGYTPDEIEVLVLEYIDEVLEGLDYSTIAVRVFGSRMTDDLYREDSDIDVLFLYEGSEKDYYLFDLLADDPMFIEGIEVDIFPERDRDLDTMMELDREHQEEKR
jgi:predicted nucleotidyltransferase